MTEAEIIRGLGASLSFLLGLHMTVMNQPSESRKRVKMLWQDAAKTFDWLAEWCDRPLCTCGESGCHNERIWN